MNNVMNRKSTKMVAAAGLALTLAFTTVGAGTINADAAQTTKYVAKPQMVTVKSDVKVRAGESTKSKVLGILKKGEKVYFVKDDYGWSKVTYKGKTGYVGTRYLNIPGKQVDSKKAPVKKATPAKASTKKVTPTKKTTSKAQASKTVTAKTAVNVRASQSKTSKVLGVLKKGEKVTVVKESRGWSQVTYKGKTGYVATQFLSTK
ncbi:SH3 domain-containing protein [Listeria booriae]|uniref:SH3 domain-containing protein n=1 Tax=Listeria booriae TaxID=1552123 RepID=A0A841W4N7_9LIST|nr:SH3 domain-containing protein [Listeria booriae]MBC1231215.1 SH3 domain-containing protein [Listeria booriae]MBC1402977.1 SH3 domain-containing protein [Listeria booriae]MBC1616177.1 SH3 domain-containing protein [Listeria booriae]MBC2368266.1 SH3 domain-containing protein [Listeria booriae]